MPSDLLTHIKHTTPMLKGKPIPNLPELTLDNLEILNDFGPHVPLTANDDPTTYPAWLFGEAPDAAGMIHNATPSCVILVERSPIDLDAFFFYFYSYNEGPNVTQVLEPLNHFVNNEKVESGMHFGDHIGDWFHNMIRFRDGKPTGIFYSQHVDGMAYDWDDETISKTDGRPIVYSARGSHANYPQSGDQLHNIALIDYCDEGQKWDPLLSAYFYRFDPATSKITPLIPPNQSSPSPPSANLTSFFYFTGLWGDKRWPDSDPRQEVIPFFGLRRFQTGPTGPRAKHLVRKGLMPDQRRKIGWKEWGVTIYMNFYPCCFKGWRAWISLGVVITVFSVIVLGIMVAVKKYRSRGYRKVQDYENIPLDEWHTEENELFSSSDDDDSD
ncbi:vacuolar protein sorting-associated protein 62 [Dactylonectria macrodidyma]|uniref:Vacuolar protein sorting-associated protein 62 n=1 Tax=Dactylonectria macrodidyma TaxID=307937 RepID=A0A9P9E274_9HYPO|nr:vacuolar protein sorting-associated protein 62 [Dactylonectria macrodidyma]